MWVKVENGIRLHWLCWSYFCYRIWSCESNMFLWFPQVNQLLISWSSKRHCRDIIDFYNCGKYPCCDQRTLNDAQPSMCKPRRLWDWENEVDEAFRALIASALRSEIFSLWAESTMDDRTNSSSAPEDRDRFLSFPFRLNFASRHCKRFFEPSQQPHILCRYVWPIRFITGPISALSRHFCFTRVMSFYSVLAKKVMYTYITVMPLAHSLIVSILQRTIEWSMSAYCIAEGARRLIWWSRGRLE